MRDRIWNIPVISRRTAYVARTGIPLGVGLLMSLVVHVLPFAASAPWIGWFLKRIAEVDGDDKVMSYELSLVALSSTD